MWMCASGPLEADLFLFCHLSLVFRRCWDESRISAGTRISAPCTTQVSTTASPTVSSLSQAFYHLCSSSFYLGSSDNLWPAFVVSSSPECCSSTGGGVSRLMAFAHTWPLLNLFEAELKAPRGVCLYQNDNTYNAQKMLNTSCLWNLRQGFVLSWGLWFLCTSARWLGHWGWQHCVTLT